MKTGFGNVKMKDAAKGNITGIGKTLGKGTFGAAGAAGSYVTKQVTGKDEKVGPINKIKTDMAKSATARHESAGADAMRRRWEKLEAKKAETGSYYSSEYNNALENIKNSKKGVKDANGNIVKPGLKQFEEKKQYWENLFQNNPTGSFTGTDGKSYTFQEAYDISSQNYETSKKIVDHYTNELDRMNKLPLYQEDVDNKKFIDNYEQHLKDKNAASQNEMTNSQLNNIPEKSRVFKDTTELDKKANDWKNNNNNNI
jgi:hypothetical protein